MLTKTKAMLDKTNQYLIGSILGLSPIFLDTDVVLYHPFDLQLNQNGRGDNTGVITG